MSLVFGEFHRRDAEYAEEAQSVLGENEMRIDASKHRSLHSSSDGGRLNSFSGKGFQKRRSDVQNAINLPDVTLL